MFMVTDAEIAQITRRLTGRDESLFAADMSEAAAKLKQELSGASVLVIGGAGTIGSATIRELLPFEPERLLVVDTNENGLAELVRDIRSSSLPVPSTLTTYPMDLGHPLTLRMIAQEGPFDVVANFAALKHVRSEKNVNTTAYLIDNNVTKAEALLRVLRDQPPRHFFCVSTDKAANPVNVMGATKRLMEDLAFGLADEIKSSTARFANVAFSNGSLLDAFLFRLRKGQPFSLPGDIRRYFVSWEESGQLCLLACMLGQTREIFTPKLHAEHDQYTFFEVAQLLLGHLGLELEECHSEEEAKAKMAEVERTKRYPCHVFVTDTTGEKSEEQFSVADEELDDERFRGIQIVRSRRPYPPFSEIQAAIARLSDVFGRERCSKEEVIAALSEYLPTFQHQERNKYLDQRM